MTASEILRAARALISDPARWTQGAFARDSSGDQVDRLTSEAVCWCLAGAVDAASYPERIGVDNYVIDFDRSAARLAAARALHTVIHDTVVSFNDDPTRTHAEVLEAIDKAIAITEASQ